MPNHDPVKYDAFGGLAIFCVGMADAVRDCAADDKILLDGMQALEEVYWENLDDALHGTVSTRLSALNSQPIRYGDFVRPNAHLICFDYARCVLEAIWSALVADGPDDYAETLANGLPRNARIDFTKIEERWPMVSAALASLDLPDPKVISSAEQHEAARLACATGEAITAPPHSVTAPPTSDHAGSANQTANTGASNTTEQRAPSNKRIIRLTVALERYKVSNSTVRAAINRGELTDHRQQGHKRNAPLLVDEREIAARWPTK